MSAQGGAFRLAVNGITVEGDGSRVSVTLSDGRQLFEGAASAAIALGIAIQAIGCCCRYGAPDEYAADLVTTARAAGAV